MKVTAIGLAAISLSLFSATNVNFDSLKAGDAPPGWTALPVSRGEPAQWRIRTDLSAPSKPNVLAQLSKTGPRFRFPVCLFDKVIATDGELSVKMQLISGTDGVDAGVVFRAADEKNYYLVRISARDHNIAMFRVQDGRFQLVPARGAKPGVMGVLHPIKIGDWNLLRVTYKGGQTTVYFNHRKLFEAADEAILTAGRAGLWTKGDTVAYFDDFHIDKKK